MNKYCTAALPLEEFGLTTVANADRWNVLTCALSNPHNGPHELTMTGQEPWLAGRVQWIQPFPDFAARFKEENP